MTNKTKKVKKDATTSMTFEEREAAIQRALHALQKGIVFRENARRDVWDTLQNEKDYINDILEHFGYRYILRDFGDRLSYAVVTRGTDSKDDVEDEISARPLGYMLSWILVVLRRTYKEWVDRGRMLPAKTDFDTVVEEVRSYTKDATDDAAFRQQVKDNLGKVSRTFHLIQFENKETILIHPVITDVVDAEFLDTFCQHEMAKLEGNEVAKDISTGEDA